MLKVSSAGATAKAFNAAGETAEAEKNSAYAPETAAGA